MLDERTTGNGLVRFTQHIIHVDCDERLVRRLHDLLERRSRQGTMAGRVDTRRLTGLLNSEVRLCCRHLVAGQCAVWSDEEVWGRWSQRHGFLYVIMGAYATDLACDEIIVCLRHL